MEKMNLQQELKSLGVKQRHIPLLAQIAEINGAGPAELVEAYHETPDTKKGHKKLYRYVLERVSETMSFKNRVKKLSTGNPELGPEIRRAIHWHQIPDEHVFHAAELGLRNVQEFKIFSKVQRITGGASFTLNKTSASLGRSPE